MQLEISAREDVLIVRPLEMTLDAQSASSFREQIAEVVREGGHSIVLDLSEVEFLDSTGLGAIVSVLKLLNGRGALVLCGIRESVSNVLRLTRMDRIFTLAPDLEEAVESVLLNRKGAFAPDRS